MKAIKSFEVMESFGMQGLEPEELMEVDGGKGCTFNITVNIGNGTGNTNSSNNGNGSGNIGTANGNASGSGNGNGNQNSGNLTDRGYPSSKQGY